MPKRITTEMFVEKARKVHGNYYDYSKSIYFHSRSPINIICPIHGEYYKTPQDHITAKCGCSKCFFDKKRNSLEKFIEKSINRHGNKYDYSKSVYTNSVSNVIINCLRHGDFIQRASHHTCGRGCPKCSDDSQKHTTQEFIEKSKKIHGDKYDYSKSNYVNWTTEIKIICNKHGEFHQMAGGHINGAGCPKCGKGRISKKETEFLNIIGIPEEFRQYRLKGVRYHADGFDITTNTVYEFLGDYWHGNPKIHIRETKIATSKITCGDAYDRTFRRFSELSDLGYKISYIWENDWKKWSKNRNEKLPILEYKK